MENELRLSQHLTHHALQNVMGGEEKFNSELLSSFNKLSPIQKDLLRGMFKENKTLEQTAE